MSYAIAVTAPDRRRAPACSAGENFRVGRLVTKLKLSTLAAAVPSYPTFAMRASRACRRMSQRHNDLHPPASRTRCPVQVPGGVMFHPVRQKARVRKRNLRWRARAYQHQHSTSCER